MHPVTCVQLRYLILVISYISNLFNTGLLLVILYFCTTELLFSKDSESFLHHCACYKHEGIFSLELLEVKQKQKKKKTLQGTLNNFQQTISTSYIRKEAGGESNPYFSWKGLQRVFSDGLLMSSCSTSQEILCPVVKL